MLSSWLRVIRVRFLLASVIAVSAGLALSWWHGHGIDALTAALTMAGVAALHASVDMLNDYWDYKRGIDTRTKRTPMSGGTGVLPEGLLSPRQVYRAGIISLVLGTAAGAYFVITTGPVIAAILGFAVVSIYFYSTRIVDSGLSEVLVGVKGAMIVLGAYYIQAPEITPAALLVGAAVGALSSAVLFVASFPDHDADKERGRKTLVIILGKKRASRILWVFPAVAYSSVIAGVIIQVLPVYSLAMLLAAPLAAISARGLAKEYDGDRIIRVMRGTLRFSRTAGALLVLGILLG
ncbi:1,4-dihydroxy-2-naphthoate octaprenyltransferase [Cenarchaeum symbiosum A]|uniref:1,4-dihydroxy-2-naphthoate octaprenyltransferase n=1 Tax=Cenarchaeum symbiosum (strain A) TaxID=414004 RepID=O74051_CENSY|nr:menaquinone biosynthesis protein [Cenarchaeum symbiosum]ABK77809.1 1,4-dihydroxy-2-naphthoate octaprenyltransferase [Cenarchaeum symbiosum A]